MSRSDSGVADAAKDRVLTILRAHPSGLRSDQVRSRLAGAGMPLDLPAVTQILHALQQQKLLTYPNRRWTLKDPLVVRPLSSMPTSQSPSRRANPAPVTVPLPAPSTTPAQSASGLGPCLPFEVVLVDAVQTAEPPALGRSLPQDWALLRRLLPYWREALRAEERPNTILSLERANIEFCGLTTAGPWWPTEQRRAEISLRVERIPPELLANLARRGNSADVFLGYPVQVIPGTDQRGAFARPIFTFACRLIITAGALKLTVPAQAIDINAGWLEKQFRDPTERRGVLQWLGITSPAAPEDDDETEPTGEPLDLPTATVRLSAYLPTTNGHLLAPTAPFTSLPQTTPTLQVINALVLFTAPTTQYSKRTLADLHTLATWNDAQLT